MQQVANFVQVSELYAKQAIQCWSFTNEAQHIITHTAQKTNPHADPSLQTKAFPSKYYQQIQVKAQ